MRRSASGAGKHRKRVRLVCGTTSMNTGLDGLMAIIRGYLRLDPYDGSVYVFRDGQSVVCRELLANEILHADETTLMVLREPGRKAQQKSYVWVYCTSGDAWHPVVLYDYQPSRAGECASRFLEGFTGLLHTDGYGAYHCKLPPEITVAGCWTHMRRKFTDTFEKPAQ